MYNANNDNYLSKPMDDKKISERGAEKKPKYRFLSYPDLSYVRSSIFVV